VVGFQRAAVADHPSRDPVANRTVFRRLAQPSLIRGFYREIKICG